MGKDGDDSRLSVELARVVSCEDDDCSRAVVENGLVIWERAYVLLLMARALMRLTSENAISELMCTMNILTDSDAFRI